MAEAFVAKAAGKMTDLNVVAALWEGKAYEGGQRI